MPVSYNANRLIPVQTISLVKNTKFSEDTALIKSSKWTIIINGTVFWYKGSPASDKTFWADSNPVTSYPPDESIAQDARLSAISAKLSAIGTLFSNQYKDFVVKGYDSATERIKGVACRVVGINFQEGPWVNYAQYQITLETDNLYLDGVLQAVEDNDTEEQWTIEPSDERQIAYRMTHNISATAKPTYTAGSITTPAWQNARTKVVAMSGMDTAIKNASNVYNLNSFGVYNMSRVENIDEINGKYSLVETWLLCENNYIDDYNISIRSAFIENESTVTIDGTITGLNSSGTGSGNRYANALSAWSSIEPTLASRASGELPGANSTPYSTTVGKNPKAGTVSYGYEFNNKYMPGGDEIERDVNIVDNFSIPVIAKHTVIFAPVGPVYQDVFTKTEYTRDLEISVQMKRKNNAFTPAKPTGVAPSIISSNTPSVSGSGEGPYVSRNSESWNEYTGRYTRSVSWFWKDLP